MKILLADDDTDMLDVTTYAFRRDGFNVITATDGEQALRRWKTDEPDLVLLDVGLPRINGFEVCRRIRQSSSTPVIMLTARGEEEHVVKGFLLGADDYVTKPFSHRQLTMRVRAVLQRRSGSAVPEPANEIEVGELKIDMQSHEVAKGDYVVRLTPLEFRILYILAINVGRVVSSTRLIEYAWGYDGGDASMLKTHICHIRQKLKLEKGKPGYITSIPHVGYSLTRP
jgi:two-component system response regulator VicR